MIHKVHIYTSTACQHELHENCRRVCKYCEKPNQCVCACHTTSGVYRSLPPRARWHAIPYEDGTMPAKAVRAGSEAPVASRDEEDTMAYGEDEREVEGGEGREGLRNTNVNVNDVDVDNANTSVNANDNRNVQVQKAVDHDCDGDCDCED